MTKTNNLICPGDACPLRHSCQRFTDWLNNEDDEAPEMHPDYHEEECWGFVRKDYYYGG